MKCDLHIHTDCSDGMFSPEKIVLLAKEKGLDCIAVTDHDTVSGLGRASAKAKEVGIGFIGGVELSSVGAGEVHILAYNLDFGSAAFAEDMSEISEMRSERNRQMEKKLREQGFDIDVGAIKTSGSVGRADIAREMVAKGYCADVHEVFDKYLGTDKLCYVRSKRLTPVEAVRFALKYGGIPVLAHPKNLRLPFNRFEQFLKPLVLAGLGGIEAQYFTHTKAERKFYGRMAKKYKLIATGGSDFHDYTHGVSLGTQSFSPSGYTKKILGIK